MLRAEAHGYRGKETMEHVVYEELEWFDKYLKYDTSGISTEVLEVTRHHP